MAFNIVTQFVVTGTDPWTNSTDPGTLLGSFRTWGNAGNFGVSFDVGELWTNRDFDANVIGIAYLNGVCNTNKYHCLQDFHCHFGIATLYGFARNWPQFQLCTRWRISMYNYHVSLGILSRIPGAVSR